LHVTYQSRMDFDRAVQDRPWLRKLSGIPMIRTGLYFLYMFRTDTIEAVLS
jgi:hypothetical protein